MNSHLKTHPHRGMSVLQLLYIRRSSKELLLHRKEPQVRNEQLILNTVPTAKTAMRKVLDVGNGHGGKDAFSSPFIIHKNNAYAPFLHFLLTTIKAKLSRNSFSRRRITSPGRLLLLILLQPTWVGANPLSITM